jgi:hypothetical protein
MRHLRKLVHLALLAGVITTLGCNRHTAAGDGNTEPGAAGGDQVVLPKPAATGGAVTGMPAKPGPHPVGEALIAHDDADAAPDATGEAGAADDAATDDGDSALDPDTASTSDDDTVVPMTSAEPSVQDALAVIADYYAAIQRHDYAHAWALWSDGGRSSGQTLQQFADGFASTDAVSVQPGAPGRMDAAAGSRYLQIPVTVTATRHDGTTRRYVGSYTLRRAVVDGASADQRAWRIGSASLHELQP